MDYAVRLTPSEETDLSGAFKYIVEHCVSAVVVEHSLANGAGKELHYHIHVEGLSISDTSLNRSLTRYKVPSGNSGRSVKTKYDKDNPKPIDRGNITYISKGRLEPVILHGVTIDEYNNLRSQWIDYGTGSRTQGRGNRSVESHNEITDFKIYLEIMDVLRTVPYKCECGICRYDNQVATEHGIERKINWSIDNEHMHINYACQVICNIRRKYHRRTPERLENEYLYQIYNDGHHMDRDRCTGYGYKHRRANPHLYAQYN